MAQPSFLGVPELDAGPLDYDHGLDHRWSRQFPLSTNGRHVVNVHGERYRLCGVNWYGASDANHVVGGLDVQNLDTICASVNAVGYTVVRLLFSNEMLRAEVPAGAIDYKLNPKLRGMSALEVFDEVVQSLGRNRVAVILNNHTTYGEWSGPPSRNSLWFDPGTIYTEERWFRDWVRLARRYSRCPHVVGYDLRNEVRPRWPLWPVWGKAKVGCQPQKCRKGVDWQEAVLEASQRLLAVMPQALIIVERIVWPQCNVQCYIDNPGPLLPELKGRLVLGVHHYSWSGPGRFVPKWSVPKYLSWADACLRAVGIISCKNYGDMDPSELEAQIRGEWGFVLERNVCPVWVSEFGADLSKPEEMSWLKSFIRILEKLDCDWAYWPLNVGPKPGCGQEETYGMLTKDWKPKSKDSDARLDLLSRIGLQPPSRRSDKTKATAKSFADSRDSLTSTVAQQATAARSKTRIPCLGPFSVL